MALPEKMSTTQAVLLYGGMGLLGVLIVTKLLRDSPCGRLRHDFEENWIDSPRDAKKILQRAADSGCSWPTTVAREVGMD